MYFTYLRRELAGRKKQTAIVAIGLAIAIALVMVVNALSAGVSAAQAQTLQSVYGVGTDLTVTGTPTEPTEGERGQRFDFGSADGASTDGTTSLSASRLMAQTMRGSLTADTLQTVSDVDGVAAATGTLTLTNSTFSGEMPERTTADQGGTTADQGGTAADGTQTAPGGGGGMPP